MPPQDTPTSEAVPQPEDVWDRIQAEGKVVVGTSADYPPFESYDENFLIDGFDIALINAIAEELDLDIELVDIAFDGLADALAVGQIDIAIAAISVTPEREEVIDFSHIYFVTEDGYVAAADSAITVNTVQDLANHRLGAQRGSIYEDWLKDELVDTGLLDETELFLYGEIEQGYPDLEAGRIDLLVMDKPVADLAVEEQGLKLAGQGLNRERYAIAMTKGQNTLRTRINQGLVTIQDQGVVADLAKIYLGIDVDELIPVPTPAPTSVPTTPQPTPIPPAGCHDGMKYISDLNYDDQDMKNPPVLQPGETFQKGWKIQNTGTCTWDGSYTLTFVQGNQPGAQMGGQPTAVKGTVAPGATYDMYVDLVAPQQPGTYQGFWQMRDNQGVAFGQRIYVGIRVPAAATATPAPTQTPSPDIVFTVDRTNIKQGECVTFRWDVNNVNAVYFYHEGQDWQQNGVAGQGSRQECPGQTLTYYLRVVKRDNTVETRQSTVYVEQVVGAPVIAQYTVDPSTITLGQCVSVRWNVQGAVNRVKLTRNGASIWDGAPFQGNLEDCPSGLGSIGYALEASGPGGTNRAVKYVNVNDAQPQPTATSVPQAPVINSFSAQPGQINQGQCVNVSWNFTGVDLVLAQVFRGNEVIASDIASPGSMQDCPPGAGQVQYRIQVDSEFGGQAQQSAIVTVVSQEPPTATPIPEQPPTINYLAITSDGNTVVDQINLGECVFITYGFEGTSLAASTLLRNGQEIDFDVTSPGSTQDCPSDPVLVGTVTYTLKVDSEFAGSTTRDAQLNVVGPQPR